MNSFVILPPSVDTLGVLARTIGAQNFLPIADECMQLGLVSKTSVYFSVVLSIGRMTDNSNYNLEGLNTKGAIH